MTSNDPEHREKEIGETAAHEDEDMDAYIPPIIPFEVGSVTTGTEEADVLLNMRAMLYRFDNNKNRWRVRGTVFVKIFKHKKFHSAQIMMWRRKSMKIYANHFILPYIKLQKHSLHEQCCVWHAIDYSDEQFNDVTFCSRFASVDKCKLFMETVEKQAEAFGKKEEKENKKVDVAAEEFEKLSVGQGNREEKAVEEETATSGSNDKEEEKEKEKAET